MAAILPAAKIIKINNNDALWTTTTTTMSTNNLQFYRPDVCWGLKNERSDRNWAVWYDD